MHVVVIGPNLHKQELGTFHVHAAGCRDIVTDPKKYGYADAAPHMEFDAETVEDVVLEIYNPHEFGYNPDTELQNYTMDFHFAPCVKELK